MRKLIFFAVHQPLLVFLILLLFLGVGVAAFNNLPIEAFPDVTDIQVTVVTLYPGQAAEEVEKQVTIPLEIALSGLPHAVRLFSHTQFGLSSTYITFDDESDNYFARQQVIERLQNVDLPEGVKPELAPLSSPIGEIYRVYLKSETKDAMELRTLMDWVVQRHLKMVPGVADVVPRGGLIKQFQVVPDFMRMRALGVDLEMLIDALKRGNLNAGGGYIELGEQQLTVRAMGLLRSRADI
jgi:heavy metal efflux system protein